MNPKYERSAERIRALIEEGESVARLERDSSVGPFIQDKVPLRAWLVKVENIIVTTFGRDSAHGRHFETLTHRQPEHSYEVRSLVGLLTGALDDLEAGFLVLLC